MESSPSALAPRQEVGQRQRIQHARRRYPRPLRHADTVEDLVEARDVVDKRLR